MSSTWRRLAVDRLLDRAHGGCVKIRELAADGARTAAYLRERVRFEPRPSDVYVATYPRSGTTWVQFMVYLLTSDRSLDFEHISQVTPWFERSLALTTRTAEHFRQMADPRVFKTHLRPEWVPPGRVVHVERDGRDVAKSYFGLYRTHLGYRGSFERFFERFMQGDLQYRSWFDHVQAWHRAAERRPILMLRYETIHAAPERTVEEVAAYLGVPIEAADRDRVVRMISRDFMKIHERLFDPITEDLLARGVQSGRFIGAGAVGEGKSSLSPEQERRYSERLDAARSGRTPLWRLPDFLH